MARSIEVRAKRPEIGLQSLGASSPIERKDAC